MNKYPLRINKYLAESGLCSRREADVLIKKKLVTVNKQTATLGMKVNQHDLVKFKGKAITPGSKKIYLAFHKPVGIICTTDHSKPDNIIDFLQYPERIYPLGRLDVATSGLIIMTNDGELVNKVSRKENKVAKEYIVQVDKKVSDQLAKKLSKGVNIGGYVTLPAKAKIIDERKISLTIIEGKNQQVRRMCEAFGYQVQRLVRVRIGGLLLGDLPVGKWRELLDAEVQKLLE